jgi:DNA (cytosine-5)-methyltransferase 1
MRQREEENQCWIQDEWCANLKTPESTEAEISFWAEAFETHRLTMGTSSKPKSRNQITKWLRSPYSESDETSSSKQSGISVVCFRFSPLIYAITSIPPHLPLCYYATNFLF